ncbi:MAG: hypothetical protein JO092_10465 [Candidatus Eremiobacteraeota bacterium]|nr:hypothetical protein [Candidatus Eremiobacteraeota bacterium]
MSAAVISATDSHFLPTYMTTSIERAWASIKRTAQERGASRLLLKPSEAKAIVTQILIDECVSPWPPKDVIAFYAAELILETAKHAAGPLDEQRV